MQTLVYRRTYTRRTGLGRSPASTGRPGGVPNEHFLEQLTSQTLGKNTPLLFLCRSGARSKAAAKIAYEAGFTKSFDILEGFEGDKDSTSHRKHMSDWCFRGLPWLGA